MAPTFLILATVIWSASISDSTATSKWEVALLDRPQMPQVILPLDGCPSILQEDGSVVPIPASVGAQVLALSTDGLYAVVGQKGYSVSRIRREYVLVDNRGDVLWRRPVQPGVWSADQRPFISDDGWFTVIPQAYQFDEGDYGTCYVVARDGTEVFASDEGHKIRLVKRRPGGTFWSFESSNPSSSSKLICRDQFFRLLWERSLPFESGADDHFRLSSGDGLVVAKSSGGGEIPGFRILRVSTDEDESVATIAADTTFILATATPSRVRGRAYCLHRAGDEERLLIAWQTTPTGPGLKRTRTNRLLSASFPEPRVEWNAVLGTHPPLCILQEVRVLGGGRRIVVISNQSESNGILIEMADGEGNLLGSGLIEELYLASASLCIALGTGELLLSGSRRAALLRFDDF